MTPLKKKAEKQPLALPIKSPQYDLFSQFVTNEESEVSNTVEVWESIPKYFFTPRQVEKLRTATGHADPYKWDYTYNGIPCAVKIQPALIEQEDGRYKAFFPSVTEELVEEVLKKILADQRYGLHDPSNVETWVRFSLSMIQRELHARGRTRNRPQIKHAIEVMASSVLILYKEGKEVWKGSILQDFVTVSRDEYLADTDAQHIARLPLFISYAINQLEYRQFNYDRLMSCDEQLTRWLYKQFIHRFRQASFMNDYHFMYSNLERDSGLLQQVRSNDNRRKAQAALDELVSRSVLISYDAELRKEGRKIVDVKYTVRPHPNFVSEQKAANKRGRDNHMQALQAGVTLQQSSAGRR